MFFAHPLNITIKETKSGNDIVSWIVKHRNQESDKLPPWYLLLYGIFIRVQIRANVSIWISHPHNSIFDRVSDSDAVFAFRRRRPINNECRYTRNFLINEQHGIRKCPVLPASIYCSFAGFTAAIVHHHMHSHIKRDRIPATPVEWPPWFPLFYDNKVSKIKILRKK